VAAAMRAVPVIIPVRFRVIDEQLVFRPDGIDGVERALTESVVAFEADHVDPDGRITWDVHVTGVATRFAEEDGPLAFRLSSEIVSGWRSEP
jgi:hypothetical protein